MVTYTSDELIPSSEFAKKFGSYLTQLQEQSVEKIAILKNNHIEAVMISKEEYEMMREALDVQEHKALYGSPHRESNTTLFQETFADIVSGKERLSPYDEGMDALDSMIDEIENADR